MTGISAESIKSHIAYRHIFSSFISFDTKEHTQPNFMLFMLNKCIKPPFSTEKINNRLWHQQKS